MPASRVPTVMTGPSYQVPAEYAEVAVGLAGHYLLERELGRGGMGIVFLARDLKLDRLVAIKMLLPHLANDARVRERFLREARTAASFSHPNVVPVHRADELGGQVFFVMGYVEGESLAEHVRRRGPLPVEEVLSYVEDVAGALHAAHARGIVHRDVKAENILIQRSTGRAMVTDFGIARIAEAAPLTGTGLVLGTVHYMSPEHSSGEPTDGRSDIYSLGVVTYYALSGRFPFEHESASAIIVAHVTKPVRPLRDVAPWISPALSGIVERCLAKEPADRFATGVALISALQELSTDEIAWDSGAQPVPHLPDDLDSPRLLSESQAQNVWERAARMQARLDPGEMHAPRSAPLSASSAYSADIVRESAREAGIGTQFIDRALAEGVAAGTSLASAPPGGITSTVPDGVVREAGPAPSSPWTGEKKAIEFEASLPGHVPERDFDAVVDFLRKSLSDVGVVSVVGRSLSWGSTEQGASRHVHASVQSRDGVTTIRVGERLSPLTSSVFTGIMAGGGSVSGLVSFGAMMRLTMDPAIAFGVAGAMLAASYGVSRIVFGTITRRRRRELREVTQRLADELRTIIARRIQPPESARRRGRLPLGD